MINIAAADIVSQLRRRFGTRGDVPLRLDDAVQLVSNVSDLSDPPWNAKKGFVLRQVQAAVAAQFPYFILRFPSGFAGSVGVVRKLGFVTTTAQTVRIGVVPDAWGSTAVAGFAGQAFGYSWDSPELYQPATITQTNGLDKSGLSLLSTTSAADALAAFPGAFEFQLQAGSPNLLDLTFALRLNFALFIQGTVVNVPLTVSAYGDEFPLE